MSQAKKKIAVLGGGCASMAAAWELTQTPDWQDKYEITVYQLGWRLGGKGASGRNGDHEERIEEHGLHVWGGFYWNAFRMMRSCYATLGRKEGTPLASVDTAWTKQDTVTWMEEINGKPKTWDVWFPPNDDKPGTGSINATAWDHVVLAVGMLLEGLAGFHRPSWAPDPDWHLSTPHWLHSILKEHGVHPMGEGAESAHAPDPNKHSVWLSLAASMVKRMHSDPATHSAAQHHTLLWLLEQFMKWLEKMAEKELYKVDAVRRFYILANFGYACVTGILRDGILQHGYDYVDDEEWSAWLRKNGATPVTMDSALVRGVYDFIFAYKHGDPTQPSVAAGTATQSLTKLVLEYKGALFFRMMAGMGDTVFGPAYLHLKQQGVQFKFFHRVKNLHLSADGTRVDSISVGQQVTLEVDEYEPMVTVKDLPSWPSVPNYFVERDGQRVRQIAEAEQLERENIDLESAWTPWTDVAEIELKRGTDFDEVVLGISLAALPDVAPELIAANSRWQDMMANILTVQTQAFQLWLGVERETLGWKFPTVLTAYAHPYETWADMSQVISREVWPKGQAPKNIAYFCGPLKDPETIPPFTDHGFPAKMKQQAKDNALAWIAANVPAMWPGGAGANGVGFNWSYVKDLNANSRGSARFDSQYWRANVSPTERYVLSVPGSTKHRLHPGDSGFANVWLAGDWVKNGLDFGCVESAVLGGLLAARALRGDSETD